MELTDDDVLEILKLFERSQFDFLQLEQGERKITVSKGGFVPTLAGAALSSTSASPAAAAPPVSERAAAAAPARAAPASQQAPAPKPQAADNAGLVPVTAPMVGKFYAAPSPAETPYVQLGTKVAAGATVGLIEVMKVFASIKTDTAGVIEKILVSTGEFVEAGQTLFLIRPER
jgi:acetyl-CoA carboxylase biotin carboxyl carrier protein